MPSDSCDYLLDFSDEEYGIKWHLVFFVVVVLFFVASVYRKKCLIPGH